MNTLTAEDLKGNIFKSVQESGILDNLKGQLRQSMINNLREKNSIGGKKLHKNATASDIFSATIHSKKGVSWPQRAIDNLIMHHMKRSRYHYTLSLFQQESGLKKYSVK